MSMTGMTMGTAVFGAVAAAGLILGRPVGTEQVSRTEAVIRQGVQEADGTSWRAHTTVLLATGPVTVDEEVVLDDKGTLVRAYTSVQENGEETRTWLDPRASLVTTEAKGAVHHEHITSDDAAWVYGPVHAGHGEAIGTPLAAWVTHRASLHHTQLRRVDAEGSTLVPVDQLVVTTGGEGHTVIVGDDAMEVGNDGVHTLHLRANNTTLVRVGSPDDSIIRFRAGA